MDTSERIRNIGNAFVNAGGPISLDLLKDLTVLQMKLDEGLELTQRELDWLDYLEGEIKAWK